MVAADDDGGDETPEGAIAIAGFVMPPEFAAETRRLDLNRLRLPLYLALLLGGVALAAAAIALIGDGRRMLKPQ